MIACHSAGFLALLNPCSCYEFRGKNTSITSKEQVRSKSVYIRVRRDLPFGTFSLFVMFCVWERNTGARHRQTAFPSFRQI